MSGLDLKAARFDRDDAGYPILVLTIGAQEARLYCEWKPTLRALGLVYLGPEFEAGIPPRTITNLDGKPVKTVGGLSDDPRVAALMERFWNACNEIGGEKFKPGPVPLPD